MKYFLEYQTLDDCGYWSDEDYTEYDTLEEALERAAEMIHKEKEWKRYTAAKGGNTTYGCGYSYRPVRILEVAGIREFGGEDEKDPDLAPYFEKYELDLKKREIEFKKQKELVKQQKRIAKEKKLAAEEKKLAAEERALYEKLKNKYEGKES